MHRRRLLLCALATALIALVVIPALAQTPAPLGSWVKGTGTISVYGNVGTFDINVTKYTYQPGGGFKYVETTADGTQAITTILSTTVTGMTIDGNTSVIRATGFWNSMPANIEIKVTDDPAGDSFTISAVPQGPALIIYGAGGPLTSGDIRIYTPPTAGMFVKGDGGISVGRNMGRFIFNAEKVNGAVGGTINYSEYNPLITAIVRPKVQVYVPVIEKLDVIGNTAVFSGRGTFNGMGAMIEVTAVDNSKSAIAIPDKFTIKATSLMTKRTIARFYYSASGPLASGDISVTNTIPILY